MGIKLINAYTLLIRNSNSTVYISHVDKIFHFITTEVKVSLVRNYHISIQ